MFVKTQMWSLMGCALVRVHPRQLGVDHANKPETARRRHVTSVKPPPVPVADGHQSRSTEVNGTAADSKNSAEIKTSPPCNSGAIFEANSQVSGTSQAHTQQSSVQVQTQFRHVIGLSHICNQ